MNVNQIAQICHEANRAFCNSIGDPYQKPWFSADPWQRDSAIKGVEFAIANPDATPKDQHNAWVAGMVSNGWVYGPIKDAALKTHPCLVTYGRLSFYQQVKDSLFRAIVKAFVDAEKENDEPLNT